MSTGTGRRSAIYPAPDLYEIHAEDFPSLRQSDAQSALRTLLPTLLPGNAEDYSIDVRTRRIPGNGVRAVGVIFRVRDLSEIRKKYPLAPLAIPAAAALLAGRKGPVQVQNGKTFDGFRIDADAAVPDTTSRGPVFIPAEEGIKAHEWHFFIEKRIKPPQMRLLIAALTLFAFSGLVFITDRLADTSENRLASSSTNRVRKEAVVSDLAAVANSLTADEKALSELQAASPDAPYALLSALSQALPPGTDLESLVIKGDGFTMRGRTPDALVLVQRLEDLQTFTEPRLERVVPDLSGNDLFTLAGRFYGR